MTFPPLMPSVEWMACFLLEVLQDKTFEDSIILANEKIASPKDFARFTIKDTGDESITLSMAVEGGGRQLRNKEKIESLHLSEHGEWRRNHLRTLEACLGRKPFFPFIYPALQNVYNDKNLSTLKDFNTAIFRILYSFIVGEDKNNDFSQFYDSIILQDRGKEIADRIDSGISSLETMSYFGKESLLGFLAINL